MECMIERNEVTDAINEIVVKHHLLEVYRVIYKSKPMLAFEYINRDTHEVYLLVISEDKVVYNSTKFNF